MDEQSKAALDGFARSVMEVFGRDLSEPADLRQAYMEALIHASRFAEEVGAEARVYDSILRLAYMLADLKRGIVHPVLAAEKISNRPPDSTFIWDARCQVALGINRLLASGMTKAEVLQLVEEEFSDVDCLLRKGANLRDAVWGWHRQFLRGKVPDVMSQNGYDAVAKHWEDQTYSHAEARADGRNLLMQAIEQGASLPPIHEDDEPDWFKDEMSR